MIPTSVLVRLQARSTWQTVLVLVKLVSCAVKETGSLKQSRCCGALAFVITPPVAGAFYDAPAVFFGAGAGTKHEPICLVLGKLVSCAVEERGSRKQRRFSDALDFVITPALSGTVPRCQSVHFGGGKARSTR